jgi:hypothetical protein
MSTYSGQIIKWEDALNSQISLMPANYAFDSDPPTKPDAEGRYPIPTPGVTKVV